MQVGSDPVVDFGIGVGDVTIDLRLAQAIGEKREGDWVGVSGLRLQAVEVNRAPVEPGRSTGLESVQLEAEGAKALGETDRGTLATAAAGSLDLACVHECLKKRARGQNDRPGVISSVAPANDSDSAARA